MNIATFIISFVLLIASFLGRNKKIKIISPVILFFALWTFITFLSMLHLYGIDKPSNEAYSLIILMLVFFFLGSITRLKIKIFKNKNVYIEKNEGKISKIGKIIFYTLSILLIVLYIIDCIIVLQGYLEGVPMWKIRRWGMETVGSTNNPLVARRTFVEEIIRNIILIPFSTIIPPIAAYTFFNSNSKKEKYSFLIISILVLLLSSIAGGGGRLGYIYYFGCFLLAFFCIYKSDKIPEHIKRKYKKIVFTIFVIGFLLVVGFTIFRTGKGNFIKQVYTYFALPPTLLSVWLPQIKEVEHTYGLLTFFGVHSYFFRVLETIGLNSLVPNIYNETYTHILNAEIFKDVGYGVGNAFVSPIYYFMIDGGYIFVCLASYLFGVIVAKYYNKLANSTINIKDFVIYALITYGVFLTFMRIQTCIPAYIISFIFANLMLKNSIKNKDNIKSM